MDTGLRRYDEKRAEVTKKPFLPKIKKARKSGLFKNIEKRHFLGRFYRNFNMLIPIKNTATKRSSKCGLFNISILPGFLRFCQSQKTPQLNHRLVAESAEICGKGDINDTFFTIR